MIGVPIPITHYNDVIMGAIASQITSLTIVYSDADERKHHSSVSLAFVMGIHRWPVNSPHKRPVIRKIFPIDDVIIKRTYSPLFQTCCMAETDWVCSRDWCSTGETWCSGHIPEVARSPHWPPYNQPAPQDWYQCSNHTASIDPTSRTCTTLPGSKATTGWQRHTSLVMHDVDMRQRIPTANMWRA